MQCRGPLEVKRAVILRQGVFSVRLFAHFHVRDGIAAFFEVSNLRDGIFRIVIKHSHWDHGGKAARDSASVEKVEAYLITPVIDEGVLVPGIHGRADSVALGAVGGVADNVVKATVRRERSDVELANGITEAVAAISRT